VGAIGLVCESGWVSVPCGFPLLFMSVGNVGSSFRFFRLRTVPGGQFRCGFASSGLFP